MSFDRTSAFDISEETIRGVQVVPEEDVAHLGPVAYERLHAFFGVSLGQEADLVDLVPGLFPFFEVLGRWRYASGEGGSEGRTGAHVGVWRRRGGRPCRFAA